MNFTLIGQAIFALACGLILAICLVAAILRRETFACVMGGAFWAAALGCKVVANTVLGATFAVVGGEAAVYGAVASVAYGASSAFWELGATTVYVLLVRRNTHSTRSMVFFGLGAGGTEAFVFGTLPLLAGILQPGDPPLALGAFAFAERLVTTFGHVTSRLLVFAGLPGAGRPKPAWWAVPAAITLFAFLDGLASWVSAPGRWDFVRPMTYGLWLAIVLGVILAEAALAWIALRRSPGRLTSVGLDES